MEGIGSLADRKTEREKLEESECEREKKKNTMN